MTTPDTHAHIASVAIAQRVIGLRAVRAHSDHVRAELGLPSRAADSVAAIQRFGRVAAVAGASMGGFYDKAVREAVKAEMTLAKVAAMVRWATPPPIPVVPTDPTERAPIYDSVARDRAVA